MRVWGLQQARTAGGAPLPLGNSALQAAQSSSRLDLGPPGSDPLDRTAQDVASMTATASTQDLAQGTCRAAPQRIPGKKEKIHFSVI